MSSLFDSSAINDAIRDPNQDVSLKIGPSKVLSAGGQTATTGGAGDPAAPSSPSGYGLNGASVVPDAQRLKRNPTLVSTPSTVQQDDIYAAQLAKARHLFNQQYLAGLRDIGFTDDSGNFIPGLFETEAARRRSLLQRQMGLAEDTVNDSALRSGAFFSGRRATNLSNTKDPYLRDISNLETDLPRMITDRYNDLTNLLGGFTVTQDELLAELAARNASRAQAAPSGPIDVPYDPGAPYMSPASQARGREMGL